MTDLFGLQDDFWWPWPVVIASWLGVLLAPRLRRAGGEVAGLDPVAGALAPGHWLWSWLPFVSAVSSTFAFTLVVGRAEHRFVLPLGFWLGLYAGVAIGALPRGRGGLAWAVPGLLLLAAALPQNLELLATQWWDARRDVEAHLWGLPPGSTVETYGLGVYLPRFSTSPERRYSVNRVSPREARAPAPLVGVAEVRQSYLEIERRRPDRIVLPEGFASRFRSDPAARSTGVRAMDEYRDAPDALDFFERVLSDRLPSYRLLQVGRAQPPQWYTRLGGRLIHVHGSTGLRSWVLERVEGQRAASQVSSIDSGN
ncbi:MAG TPA: hypothetical protein VNN80_08070 [Polyangiaceae bacterium]|nr:hypothetical protein [Polyangiaceae bacterium]